MTAFMKVNILLVFIILLGCNDSKVSTIEIKTYKETPVFIKNYLDSLYNGKFTIAEAGERWNSGCIEIGNEPSCQFISAIISDNQFQMKFLAGGLTISKRLFKLSFRDEQVADFSVTNFK
jgi:hypothetical protein